MEELFKPKIYKRVDNKIPLDWDETTRSQWIHAEERAYSVYLADANSRRENSLFFNDYFLSNREPQIAAYALKDSIFNSYYYKGDELIGYSSLFLCDFRSHKISWHGLDVGQSVGIITRKSFSIRIPELIDPESGLPFIRIDNLQFIRDTITRYPQGTNFSICAHLQPESYLLIRNLVKLAQINPVQLALRKIEKFQTVLRFFPNNILNTIETEEAKDNNGTSYIVAKFCS